MLPISITKIDRLLLGARHIDHGPLGPLAASGLPANADPDGNPAKKFERQACSPEHRPNIAAYSSGPGTRGRPSARIGITKMTDIEWRVLRGSGEVEPIAVRLPEASRVSGLSRSELYRRAGRGEIVFLKCGTTTLVTMESLRATVASLPRAVIRPQVGRAEVSDRGVQVGQPSKPTARRSTRRQ
jgi:hypothetical protein